jgi:hypothetical protein
MSNFSEQSDLIAQQEAPWTTPRDNLERRVFRATVVVLATLAAAYILWLLVDLLLLLFACALVSLILLTFTNAIRRRIKFCCAHVASFRDANASATTVADSRTRTRAGYDGDLVRKCVHLQAP